jgi:hypothetical protein
VANNAMGIFLVKNVGRNRMIDLDWKVIISHSYREANKYANVLVNVCCVKNTLRAIVLYRRSSIKDLSYPQGLITT